MSTRLMPLALEIEQALALLERRGYQRAANRLRAASRKELAKLGKRTAVSRKPRPRQMLLRGGSGRSYPVKLAIPREASE